MFQKNDCIENVTILIRLDGVIGRLLRERWKESRESVRQLMLADIGADSENLEFEGAVPQIVLSRRYPDQDIYRFMSRFEICGLGLSTNRGYVKRD